MRAVKKIIQILFAFTALSGCEPRPVQVEEAVTPNDVKSHARKAWAKCLFELDKVEALRGRNLDDLNSSGAVARNQFMMDCFSATDATLTPELLEEMGRYAANNERSPSDTNLNSGTRKLPGDEPPAR